MRLVDELNQTFPVGTPKEKILRFANKRNLIVRNSDFYSQPIRLNHPSDIDAAPWQYWVAVKTDENRKFEGAKLDAAMRYSW